jgi:hypothetical protein
MKDFIFVVLIFTVSCQKDDNPELLPANRTIIVYMAADNDLSGDALVDLEEMQQLLEKEGNCDSATQGGTGDKSESHEPRQGETPEVSPRGSALPP